MNIVYHIRNYRKTNCILSNIIEQKNLQPKPIPGCQYPSSYYIPSRNFTCDKAYSCLKRWHLLSNIGAQLRITLLLPEHHVNMVYQET